jgi:hypothetical protein
MYSLLYAFNEVASGLQYADSTVVLCLQLSTWSLSMYPALLDYVCRCTVNGASKGISFQHATRSSPFPLVCVACPTDVLSMLE